MQLRKSTPRPHGFSCLTCRQRRKKCDRIRPVCERCTKGGFQCLGYDREESGSRATIRTEELGDEAERVPIFLSGGTLAGASLIPPKAAVEQTKNEKTLSGVSLGAHEVETRSPSPTPLSLDPIGLQDESGNSVLSTGVLHQLANSQQSVPASNLEETSTVESSRVKYDEMWPQEQSGSLTRTRSCVVPTARDRPPEWPPSPVDVSVVVKDIGAVTKVLQRSIPPSVSANAQMRESYFAYILNNYQLQRLRNSFQSPSQSLVQRLTPRMKRSETILSFLYLGAKIFQALADRSQAVTIQSCIHWMDKVDHQVTGDPPSNPPMDEVEDRLTGLLELGYLKFVVAGTVAGYLLLRRTLPTFLQLVSTDPDIWSERRGILRISFPRALIASRNEIRRFMFYETMCALVLGVAPLGEYDSSDFPIVPEDAPPLEWIHGVPVEFLVNIAQVHTWRASHPGVPNLEDWPILELRTNAWKPRATDLSGPDSSDSVARMAVQESWRHATLIYIYMGMCGLNSHDPRVQSSVRQIIQLIRLTTDTPIDIHFSVPCVIAGLAARYERQREFVRNKLGSFEGTRVWVLQGADFVSVLDHLWHGVAANGGAVTWDDYVNSRCIRLPIL